MVRVKSNAHALRGKLAQRMKDEVDPFLVEVSLHGASPESHDRQTRVPGSFARLIANLREARALGLRIKLNSPLTLWNEHEIEAMYALADELGVPDPVRSADHAARQRRRRAPADLAVAPRASPACSCTSGTGTPRAAAKRASSASRCAAAGRDRAPRDRPRKALRRRFLVDHRRPLRQRLSVRAMAAADRQPARAIHPHALESFRRAGRGPPPGDRSQGGRRPASGAGAGLLSRFGRTGDGQSDAALSRRSGSCATCASGSRSADPEPLHPRGRRARGQSKGQRPDGTLALVFRNEGAAART